MPGNRIRRDSWRIIETVLLRYPDRKEEYKEYLENIMGASDGSSKITDPTEAREKPQSVTEAKALKLTSAYAECSYSERQMHRIVNKVIWQVGRYIGEIN